MNGTTLTIVLALVASPVLGVLLSSFLRPRRTPAEELQQVREDRAEDRTRMDTMDTKLNKLTDYVHVLRQHIAEEKGPPPPPWPEGLNQ